MIGGKPSVHPMKLYYVSSGCYLSPYIVAQEAGIDLRLVRVDRQTKQTAEGRDFLAINPKGYTPALELDDGQVLTEGPVVTQYLADLKPACGLAPPCGTLARYRLQEMLGYINSELHKTYSPLFKPGTHPETRKEREAYLRRRYGLIEDQLSRAPYLLGEHFTAPDAYLFTVTSWAPRLKLDLSMFTNVLAFQERVGQRASVKAALAVG
jgi:glutathione S-transferase